VWTRWCSFVNGNIQEDKDMAEQLYRFYFAFNNGDIKVDTRKCKCEMEAHCVLEEMCDDLDDGGIVVTFANYSPYKPIKQKPVKRLKKR
jgi:hypothetical protein